MTTPLCLRCGSVLSGVTGMCVRGVFCHTLPPIATDHKTVAERKWQAPVMAPKPQKPCDVGLFSDDRQQLGMFDK